MDSENTNLKKEFGKQMNVVRREMLSRMAFLIREFDLPMELVATTTMILAFDVLNGLENPEWEDGSEDIIE